MKISVTYNRKVSTPIQYESLTIGKTVEFDTDGRTADEMYESIQKWVDDKVTQRLYQMEEALKNGRRNNR